MVKYKNYIILAAFLLGTIILLLYVLKWHEVYEENRRNTAIISKYINEINVDEFDNYISDNRDIVNYFGITVDDDCRQFESEFKDYIIEHHLQESIVYLNVNALKGDDLSGELNSRYNSAALKSKNRSFSKVPALGIFKNAVMIDFINGDNLTIDKAIKLLEKYEIVEDIVDINN